MFGSMGAVGWQESLHTVIGWTAEWLEDWPLNKGSSYSRCYFKFTASQWAPTG